MSRHREADIEAVIGLEIHCQLATRTKIFCGCPTSFGAPPNQLVCPVCLGLPGALPVLNSRAVAFAVKMALATRCTVHPISVFARKHYFYPDLPKGYQISQYEEPLATGGVVDIDVGEMTKRVSIVRIHLEEDAGKILHGAGHRGDSLIDFNRAGVPLIEIVSGPDLRTPEEARAYMKTIHRLATSLGICEGNLERGNFRCDANISVREQGAAGLGTRVEIKNLNSFRFLARALEHEIARQKEAFLSGEVVFQQTRLWDQTRSCTSVMREKEEADDYRYFPEPDLPPLVLAEGEIERLREGLPELPRARAQRFMRDYQLPGYDADVLTSSVELADFFEETAVVSGNSKAASNWIMSELLGVLHRERAELREVKITPDRLGRIIEMVDKGLISGKMAKEVFEAVYASGQEPERVVEARGLRQLSDEDALSVIVEQVLEADAVKWAACRAGKNKLLGFFVGQVLVASGGRANPQVTKRLLQERLAADREQIQ